MAKAHRKGRPAMAVEGLEAVMKNINREIEEIRDRSLAGLLAAGLKVQRESQKRTPIDTGNLKASAFTRKAQDHPTTVEVGHGAAYAPFVHENLEATFRVGGAKFLEGAARDLSAEIVNTVAEYARVRGGR